MRAGSLDRRVSILRRGAAIDDGLTSKPGPFAVLASRFASVKPARGGERLEAMGIAGRAELSVWLRFDPVTRTITERDAVDYAGTRYEIIAPPLEIGRGEGFELFLTSAERADASVT